MKFNAKQKRFFRNCTHRYNFAVGAVRSGKTYITNLTFVKMWANAPSDGEIFLIGKTKGSLERNVINPLLEMLGGDAVYYPGKMQLHLWGRIGYCMGANDERSEGKIRGSTIGLALLDEITLLPESFFNMLKSRLSVYGAKCIGTTNPDNPNHWFKKFIDTEGLDIYTEHFTIDDNAYLPEEYVESIKREYVGVFYKRYILGLWVAAQGAIYDFLEENHFIKKAPARATRYYVGADYGTSNPCVFLLLGYNENASPRMWVEKEYYYDSHEHQMQKTDSQYADDFEEFIPEEIRKMVVSIIIDPSAASFKTELISRGFYNIVDADNSVIDGIRIVSDLIKNGECAILEDCRHTKTEHYGYTWDKNAQKRGEDKPTKVDDHTCDTLRYILYTVFGAVQLDYNVLNKL